MSADGYRCSECRRPGVRITPRPGVAPGEPGLAIGETLGPCSAAGCDGELVVIDVETADAELRDALIETGVLRPTAGRITEITAAAPRAVSEPEPI